jgi:phosphoglucosamine mutase
VRASGTEPLVRVMVEASDPELAESVASSISTVVERELGGQRAANGPA